MNRKVIFLTIACLTFAIGVTLASVWFYKKHFISFEMVMVADGFVQGKSGAWGEAWSQEWKSSDGVMVYERKSHYESEGDARIALEREMLNVVSVSERVKLADSSQGIERIVGVFNSPVLKKTVTSMIVLRKDSIYRIDAPSLQHALAFEKYRDRE
ncbi:MAG TPA: hypothetical protein VGV59_10060 [Pyrinomonadaceae bacterium]|nr:hypothetical protein [Pyrinomonadaceae bacterium]